MEILDRLLLLRQPDGRGAAIASLITQIFVPSFRWYELRRCNPNSSASSYAPCSLECLPEDEDRIGVQAASIKGWDGA